MKVLRYPHPDDVHNVTSRVQQMEAVQRLYDEGAITKREYFTFVDAEAADIDRALGLTTAR
jgi:myo-inositol catabolism protein IolC